MPITILILTKKINNLILIKQIINLNIQKLIKIIMKKL